MSAGADATTACVVVTGELFLDIELSRLAATYILTEIWRDGILPYLPFLERQRRTKWSQREQLASLADTFECELETQVGAAFWKHTLKPGLIQHGAVITGSWPLRIMLGDEMYHKGSDIDVLIPAPSDADLFWESPLAPLFRDSVGGFHVQSAGGSEMPYVLQGIASTQLVRHQALQTRRMPWVESTLRPLHLIAVKLSDEDRDANGTAKTGALVRWVEHGFDFDACKTVYDPSNTKQPVYVSPRTTVNRLCRGQTTFHFVYDPCNAWERMLKYKLRGIVFDPIDPDILLDQIRTCVHNWPWEKEDARLVKELERANEQRRLHTATYDPFTYPIVLDVWACDTDNTFCAFQPSPALYSRQFQRNVASRTTPCTFAILPGSEDACIKSCIFAFCHRNRRHIHLTFNVVLLIHDRSANVESVGSKHAASLVPTDGRPSPAKRPRLSASASSNSF